MFKADHSRRFEALSVVFDLEGFSPFTVQPDNHRVFARFLNFVFEKVNESLAAAQLSDTWTHRKFLGGGALYLWATREGEEAKLASSVVLAFHNLFRVFPTEILDEINTLGVRAMPKKVRVGIAFGEVTELKTDSGFEYVGFSINLAARLESYCPEIGFLVSASVPLTDQFVQEYSLSRAKAKRIMGITEEIRFVEQDAEHLTGRMLEKWFDLQ